MPEDIVRVIRILEYVGPRSWVETTLERAAVPLNGQRCVDKDKVIRSAMLGDFAEILIKAQNEHDRNSD